MCTGVEVISRDLINEILNFMMMCNIKPTPILSQTYLCYINDFAVPFPVRNCRFSSSLDKNIRSV